MNIKKYPALSRHNDSVRGATEGCRGQDLPHQNKSLANQRIKKIIKFDTFFYTFLGKVKSKDLVKFKIGHF